MRESNNMGVLLPFVFFSFLCLFSSNISLAGPNHEWEESSCGDGLAIKFPFRLKDGLQPRNCGYPGFDLSCSNNKRTIFQLPNIPIKLFVREIDYRSEEISVYGQDNCLPIENLKSLSTYVSPFNPIITTYALFNCSSTNKGVQVSPCFNGSGYTIRVSFSSTFDPSLVSCTKMFNLPSFPQGMLLRENFRLKWSGPNCASCEAKGMRCRFVSDHASNETECFTPFKPRKDVSGKLVIAGATIGSFVFGLLVIAFFRIYHLDKIERESRLRVKKFLEDYSAFKPSRYSYADIKKITNRFEENLGEGTYGTVYKGKLSNEVFVAVKILNNSKGNGEEFVNEVGTIVRIHHLNVVRLVGFCADGFSRALVYEFLPNDTLEKYISSPVGTNCSLNWETLRDISLGVARGLEYLHQGCDQRIVHFDIKPQNILLDQNFTPKISDFGLAKLCAKDQSLVSMSTARGTMGYIAPEVFSRNFGSVSYKSDVYSFGMLLLEMVGGRRITDGVAEIGRIYYPEWIYNLLEDGEDLRIHIGLEKEDTRIAKKLAIIGLSCIQWHPGDRPSMKVVVQMLEGGGDLLAVPPNPFAPINSNANVTSKHVKQLQELEMIPE